MGRDLDERTLPEHSAHHERSKEKSPKVELSPEFLGELAEKATAAAEAESAALADAERTLTEGGFTAEATAIVDLKNDVDTQKKGLLAKLGSIGSRLRSVFSREKAAPTPDTISSPEELEAGFFDRGNAMDTAPELGDLELTKAEMKSTQKKEKQSVRDAQKEIKVLDAENKKAGLPTFKKERKLITKELTATDAEFKASLTEEEEDAISGTVQRKINKFKRARTEKAVKRGAQKIAAEQKHEAAMVAADALHLHNEAWQNEDSSKLENFIDAKDAATTASDSARSDDTWSEKKASDINNWMDHDGVQYEEKPSKAKKELQKQNADLAATAAGWTDDEMTKALDEHTEKKKKSKENADFAAAAMARLDATAEARDRAEKHLTTPLRSDRYSGLSGRRVAHHELDAGTELGTIRFKPHENEEAFANFAEHQKTPAEVPSVAAKPEKKKTKKEKAKPAKAKRSLFSRGKKEVPSDERTGEELRAEAAKAAYKKLNKAEKAFVDGLKDVPVATREEQLTNFKNDNAIDYAVAAGLVPTDFHQPLVRFLDGADDEQKKKEDAEWEAAIAAAKRRNSKIHIIKERDIVESAPAKGPDTTTPVDGDGEKAA